MENFNVSYRNPGHWDIYTKEERAFRIRGAPGRYKAMDERTKPYPVTEFKTIGSCMQFICDELMFEQILVQGQEPIKIAAWNL